MKRLTMFLFFIFTSGSFVSCDPEEITGSTVKAGEEVEIFADTGDQKKEIDDDKNTD
ncbi:hypothetical protein OQ279_14855 [Salinimicrobium sp. MT39]|uniref:Uncharacterized protein n=1 Tax=Salinimicrobium profundisediminis TaxID=2994553 RepID=A0A9X3CZA0_9FLAO|nr:hypothetical protein [Salinimicrobium profundisediminis]MCX2839429.1 hypothetical protein [Salinimicrobium profundisediminis]